VPLLFPHPFGPAIPIVATVFALFSRIHPVS